MGKHYPGGSKPKLDFKKIDQFASVRAYLGSSSQYTAVQIAERLNIPHDEVLEILKRIRGQPPVEPLNGFSGKEPLSIKEIQRRQEPTGCRTIYGDVKEDLDWFRCQKPLKRGVRYLFCDDCYSRFVKVGGKAS